VTTEGLKLKRCYTYLGTIGLRFDSSQTSCTQLHQFGNQDEESYTRGMKRLQNVDLKSSSLKGKLSMPGALASASESENEMAPPPPRGKTKLSEAERQTTKISEEDTILAMGDDKSKLLGYAKACLPIVATICFSQ
jgi:hypothetical protein